MPVISPRRSSTSASGSLYGATSATSGGGSSGSAAAASSSAGLSSYSPSASSYLHRASSLSKSSPAPASASSAYSTYSSYTSPKSYLSSAASSSLAGYSPSTYTPRSSLHRSSLSGGSSSVASSYRNSALYLGASSNDSVSTGRYGYGSTRSSLKRDDSRSDSSRKPPRGSGAATERPAGLSERRNSGSGTASRPRLTASSSSSSLARLVATSGADMYEKYSPANYKTPCELARSRSAASDVAAVAADDTAAATFSASTTSNSSNIPSVSTSVTLERPRSRYSRLYQPADEVDEAAGPPDTSASFRLSVGSRHKLANSSSATSLISNSSSCSDVPTATFTLPRPSRVTSSKATAKKSEDEENGGKEESTRRNGSVADYKRSGTGDKASTNGYDATLSAASQQVKELKLSPSRSATGIRTEDATGTGSSNSLTNDESGYNHNNNNDESNNNENGLENEMNGDVATSATIKLNADSSPPSNTPKVRSTTTGRSILPPPSPTSSRYWDRDSSRTASTSASANNSNLDHDLNKSDAKHEGLCGLRNIGNTCFMNSVIQCLSHTTELTKFLRSYNASRSGSSKDQAILCEFAKLIREMWTNNVNSVTPMELKRAFSTKHRMYSDYNQQDAQEFLRFFLDSLHGALNSGIKGEVLKIDDNLSDNKKAELNWEWYTRHENSLIRDLFVGQLKSTLRCTTCGNTSVTFDPFWDLSVSLPSSSRCKLEACLDLFIKEEVLDGDEMPTCSKCQTRRKCTKSFTIQRFPKYLVIHLKRFSETRWSKMSNIVEFPTGERELNMGPYGSNRNSMYYSLYAISNHMGSTAGGHYVALCKHPVSKRWHEFNDNIVSDSLSESQLVSSSAYILFYERV